MRSKARSLLRRRPPGAERTRDAPVAGPVRLGRKTKDLVKRLRQGEVALIHHTDLDRMAAEDLVACGVAAVVNVAPSSTGRYPNAGPLIVARAGIRLIDAPSESLFDELSDGEIVTLAGGEIKAGERTLAQGTVMGVPELEQRLEQQRERIGEALADFAQNTIQHISEEGQLLAGEIDLPRPRTRFRDRQVLIVVRGTTYRKDLRALRAYIQDVRPVLVGVDGGADAILEEGLKPDLILGDMDSATDEALRCGAEVIVHAYPDGRAPGSERLHEIGVEHLVAPAIGTSQDVAMLLAFENGAELIVSVGAHFNLLEFLDKNRAGMSSTFLTRLRIGETLVDAKGVSRLYNPGISARLMIGFLAAAVVLAVVVVLVSDPLGEFFDLLWLKIKVLLDL
jgi:uncharacterized membrane-anchored protein